MNDYINVKGDLYNKYMDITSVSRPRYQHHSNRWCFVIYTPTTTRNGQWSHNFKTEWECEEYHREFCQKVLGE